MTLSFRRRWDLQNQTRPIPVWHEAAARQDSEAEARRLRARLEKLGARRVRQTPKPLCGHQRRNRPGPDTRSRPGRAETVSSGSL